MGHICGDLQEIAQVANSYSVAVCVRHDHDLGPQTGQRTGNEIAVANSVLTAHLVTSFDEALRQLVYVSLYSPHVRIEKIRHHAEMRK